MIIKNREKKRAGRQNRRASFIALKFMAAISVTFQNGERSDAGLHSGQDIPFRGRLLNGYNS